MFYNRGNKNDEKIRSIHLLINFGTSHYFENEIEKILKHTFIIKETDIELVMHVVISKVLTSFLDSNRVLRYFQYLSRNSTRDRE